MQAGLDCSNTNYVIDHTSITWRVYDFIQFKRVDSLCVCDSLEAVITEPHFDFETEVRQSWLVVTTLDTHSLAAFATVVLERGRGRVTMNEQKHNVITSDSWLLIALLYHREKPLAMYVFSKDKSVSDRLLQNTSAGGVCVNDTIMQSSGQCDWYELLTTMRVCIECNKN